MSAPKIENELSTGLVIAGAYADKLRRTLFAQLRDLVRKNRDFAREVARAAGEMNRLIYIILVEELKSDKGDVVRIRVKYEVDTEKWRITWKYNTLRIEYFKRYPDEEVKKIIDKILKEKLEEVQEQYREAPTREEAEKILKGEVKPEEEWEKEETIRIIGSTQPLEREEAVEEKKEEKEEKPEEKTEAETGVELASVLGGADPIGETLDGGLVFKIVSTNGDNIGVASVEPYAGGYMIDCIIIHGGKAYRIHTKASHQLNEYMDNPSLLLDEIKRSKPVAISKEDAESLIRSKMESLA